MKSRLLLATTAAFFLALFSTGCFARDLILNGLYPGDEGLSAPRWAVADLSSNIAAPAKVGNYLGTTPLSQLRKNGRTSFVGGLGLLASTLIGQSHINFTDISTGQVVSSVNVLLPAGFEIAHLFTESNASVLYALASSFNRSENFFVPFVIDKLRTTPTVIALPRLSFPADLRDPSAPMVATKTPDDILIMVGGSLLYWRMSDLTAEGKLIWSLGLPNGLGVDTIAAVTTDTKVTNTKVALIWDHFFSSTVYLLDLASPQAAVPIDLRKFCGGETLFSVRSNHAFFNFFSQQFHIVVDACSSASISLISLDVSAYPPSANVKPQLDTPLDNSIFNFDKLFPRL